VSSNEYDRAVESEKNARQGVRRVIWLFQMSDEQRSMAFFQAPPEGPSPFFTQRRRLERLLLVSLADGERRHDTRDASRLDRLSLTTIFILIRLLRLMSDIKS